MLGRDAKIPHSSLQRRAFVHGHASGEFKAAFGDADAGRRDPDRRLQLFRHASQVLRRRSLGVLPNAGDLRLEQRARRHKLGIKPSQSFLETLGLYQRGRREHLFDAGPRQFDKVLNGALGDPHSMGGMRQDKDRGEIAEDGIRRERGSERKLEKVLVGNKQVRQCDMVAAGALEAECVPRVPDLSNVWPA